MLNKILPLAILLQGFLSDMPFVWFIMPLHHDDTLLPPLLWTKVECHQVTS